MACLHALHASFPRDTETDTETRPRRGTAVDRRALDLLDRLARLPADDPRRADTRTRVIEAFLPFATRLARRYAGSAESLDDLVQVAAIGLIEAVDRYDPDHPGHGFLAFATPTIRGELRRHFRDRGWAIRPPRGVQELRLRMQAAEEQLSQRLHRSAGVADLAAVLGVGTAEITETLLAEQNYRPMSLNAPTNRDDDGRPPRSLEEVVGSIDRDLDAVAARVSLPAALTRLPERDRTVLALRFVADLSQTEIGRRLGISQMHVSRIIASALAQLRAYLDGDDPVPAIRPRYGQRSPNDGAPGAHASGWPLPATPHRGTADAGAVPTRDTGNAVAAGGGR